MIYGDEVDLESAEVCIQKVKHASQTGPRGCEKHSFEWIYLEK